jgi:hypothetical protein
MAVASSSLERLVGDHHLVNVIKCLARPVY